MTPESSSLEDNFPEIPRVTEDDFDTLPEGYHLSGKPEDMWGLFLVANDESESFRLTDRSFSELDHHMHGQLMWHIESLVSNLDRPARILDIGCGPKGAAADELQTLLGDKAEVHGVDFLLAKPEARFPDFERRATLSKAPITALPYQDDYFDFIYSWQVLEHICHYEWIADHPDRFEKYKACIAEIARVLGNDREAFLDDKLFGLFPYIPPNHPWDEFLQQHNLMSSQGIQQTRMDGAPVHIMGSWIPFLKLRKYNWD